VEILLATDAELNSLVSVKHIAPYRQGGLGTAGRGLGKRVRDLKDDLRKRRWGEEYRAPRDQHGKGGKERARDSGWPKKVAGDEEDGENKRKGKRMGKKERMKAKLAEGGLGAEQSEAANPVNSTTGEKRKSHPEAEVLLPNVSGGEGGEAKKKRRKKKHGQQSGGELAVHE
jgi:protein KRI1